MSEERELKSKLTLEDLDRFLDLRAEKSVDPAKRTLEIADTAHPAPYIEAAAVLDAFDPFQLQATDSGSAGPERDNQLNLLLRASEPIVNGPRRGLWSLSFSARRDALKRLETRDRMKHALAANSDRIATPVQRMFEQALEEDPIELTRLPRDELAALITVVSWTEGILDRLPELTAIRSNLAKADLLAPMQRLAGRGFVNRQREIGQLKHYVFSEKPSAPLFICGTGGVGKSTLLARFILQHLEPAALPFGYIDIDRPAVRPDRPLSILLEAVVQIQRQLELPGTSASSLIKEISYAVSREESGRHVDSSGYEDAWYFKLFGELLPPERTTQIFIDTFEEAQFLGPDVVWRLLNFLLQLERSLPTVRIILSGRALPREFLELAFPQIFEHVPDTVLDNDLALEQIPLPERPMNLGILDDAAARELLQRSLSDAGLARLGEDDLDDVVGIVGRNPMCIKLAARLLRDEGVDKLREERGQLLVKLKAEKMQAFLYGRILRHVHGDDVRKVAYPGLIIRRISPDVIRQVLAKPCHLKLDADHSEHDVFRNLGKEAALVERDPLDGSLRHRTDVRRAMLEDLTDHIEPDTIEQIDSAAVAFYEKQSGAVPRAEEIYHRLRLFHPAEELNKRWLPEVGEYLGGALEELPAQQRLWLAEKLGTTLDESVRRKADQAAWEDQTARAVDRFLASAMADEALSLLHEREKRLPRSHLFSLEAEAYRFLARYDEAIGVARLGVDELTKAGAIDMALSLLLKMVVIEETRGDLEAADRLLNEAEAYAAHSRDELLRLRTRITKLRLHRQLRPEAHEERARLRRSVMAGLSDEVLYRLRSHPVLLREIAAEIGKDDARVTSTALETLGLEVATDDQARAIGQAIGTLDTVQSSEGSADTELSEMVKQFYEADFDPELIRTWVTKDLTAASTQRLGRSLRKTSAGASTEVLRKFRDYFRTSVDSAMRGPKK